MSTIPRPSRPATHALADIVVGPEVGDGGEGAVHDVRVTGSSGPVVMKRYSEPLTSARQAHLTHLVAVRPHLRLGMSAYAWPEALITEGGQVVGVLMPRVPGPFWASVTLRSGRVQQRLREVQYLMFGPEKLRGLGLPYASLTARLELLAGLVAAVSRLHHLGLVYGDLSARNVLYTTDGEPKVHLLDCDGIVRVGSRYVIDSPDWTDPAAPKRATPASDVHKLGLFAARILTVRPTTRDAPPAGGAPADFAPVLSAMLDPRPQSRPEADEVAAALARSVPGGSASEDGRLPEWGLRAGTGELVLMGVPEAPASRTASSRRGRRSRQR